MKKLIIALFFTFLFPIDTSAEEIILEWDPPAEQVDGINIYQKTAHEWDYYDYDNPVAVVSEGSNIKLELPGEDNKVLQYLWVVRAFRGEKESPNSNEVWYKVVNTVPLSPVNVSGIYDADAEKIILSWDQEEERHPVDHWVIFYKIDDGEFEKLGEVDQGEELTLESEFKKTPDKALSIVTLAVVSFRRSGVFSPNSEEVKLTIDKRDEEEVLPIDNLRINVEIPI